MIPGEKILGSRFEVQEVLGAGYFGTVARVKELRSGRILAIKELNPDQARDPAIRERFLGEAMLGQKGLPGIVKVYECTYGDSTLAPGARSCFLVMEHLPGGTLADLIAGGPLPWERVASIGLGIGQALEPLHTLAVHRDLKPDNILLDAGGRPVVADLGIAHLHDGLRSTTAGNFVGTPAYAAPEQAAYRPAEIGPGSDLYSLALIMYELGTGQRAQELLPGFFGSRADQIHAISTRMPPPPSRFSPGIPAGLERLIMKNLAKSPKDRHQKAREFCKDLCLAMGWLPLPSLVNILEHGKALLKGTGRRASGIAPALGKWAVSGAVAGLVLTGGMLLGPDLVREAKASIPVAHRLAAPSTARTPGVAFHPTSRAATTPAVEPPPAMRATSAAAAETTPSTPAPLAIPVATVDPADSESGFITASLDTGGGVTPSTAPSPSPGLAGEVRGTRVYLRSEPALEDGNILATLDDPHPVRLLALDDGWYRVATTVGGRNLEGFIWAGLVRPEAPVSGILLGVCRADGVLLREGPGTACEPVGDRACYLGEKLLIVGQTEEGDYYQLMLPDKTKAWCSADLVDTRAY